MYFFPSKSLLSFFFFFFPFSFQRAVAPVCVRRVRLRRHGARGVGVAGDGLAQPAQLHGGGGESGHDQEHLALLEEDEEGGGGGGGAQADAEREVVARSDFFFLKNHSGVRNCIRRVCHTIYFCNLSTHYLLLYFYVVAGELLSVRQIKKGKRNGITTVGTRNAFKETGVPTNFFCVATMHNNW